MKVTHFIGIGAVAGGGAWFLIRQAERKKLAGLLAQSDQLKAIAVVNKVYSATGDFRYAKYTAEELAKAIKVTNTISAEDAYVEILNNLPHPKAIEQEGGILSAESYEAIDAASRAITGKGLEELQVAAAEVIGTPAGEGRLPDWLPVIGTKEKASWWKSWLGEPHLGGYYVE